MNHFDELLPWGEDCQFLIIAGHIDPYRFWHDCCHSSWRYEYDDFDETSVDDVYHAWASEPETPFPGYEAGEYWFWHTEQTEGSVPITVLDLGGEGIPAHPPKRPYWWEETEPDPQPVNDSQAGW